MAEPDQRYGSVLVSQLTNYLMQGGKKAVANRIVYGAMEKLAEQTKQPALTALETAVNNAGPSMELKSRRVGGANYQVPIEVRPSRRIALSLRWIIAAARGAKGTSGRATVVPVACRPAYRTTGSPLAWPKVDHRFAPAFL